MPDGKAPGALALEVRRVDILRTLIHRGFLALLGYKGPYIDYADRPAEGNYRLRYLGEEAHETESASPSG